MDTPAGKDPQDQPVTLQLKIPLPREPDSKNEIAIARAQTSGETSQYPGRVWLREMEKAQVRFSLMGPAKVMLLLSIGRGVAESTLAPGLLEDELITQRCSSGVSVTCQN